jgi:hypothetical protein
MIENISATEKKVSKGVASALAKEPECDDMLQAATRSPEEIHYMASQFCGLGLGTEQILDCCCKNMYVKSSSSFFVCL